MNYYPNNYNPNFNQFYGNQVVQPQIPKMQPIEQNYQPYAQTQGMFKSNITLQGKSVDSIDVVKAMDIPLDGSVSYFPLTDGTAIVTKQLQPDGSSKTIVYKPSVEDKVKDIPKYITENELNELEEKIKSIDNSSLKEDIKFMKRQIKDLSEDLKKLNDDIKK